MNDNSKTPQISVLLQIYLPLFLGSALILGLGVWAALASARGTDISRFADVSAVLLIIPVLIGSLIPLAFLLGLAYGVIKLIEIIPSGTRRVQEVLEKIRHGVDRGSRRVVQPFLAVGGMWAGLKVFLKRERDA